MIPFIVKAQQNTHSHVCTYKLHGLTPLLVLFVKYEVFHGYHNVATLSYSPILMVADTC